MRILVLQLARFGDIFVSWPTLRALRRKYPGAEIHCVVRQRFSSAMSGCESVDKIWNLDTAQILEPLLTGQSDVDVSLIRLTEWTELLAEQDFDLVVNLSFSPFSSFLASLLTNGNTEVRGYTRQSDGFLAIPDDSSAYFYAQVGVGRYNRYHLAEIMAAVANVELINEDWRAPEDWNLSSRLNDWRVKEAKLHQPYIVVHLGASQVGKVYPAFKWHRVLLEVQRHWNGYVVLIGSQSEQNLAADVLAAGGCERILNLMGQTDFADVASLIHGAELVMGGDSAPMHIAAFTQTRCLNLSFTQVNFWETGPRTLGSRIVVADTPEDLPSDRVSSECMAMLQQQDSGRPTVYRTSQEVVGFQWHHQKDENFEWQMIQAVYSGGEWPVVQNEIVAKALWQMREAVNVAVSHIGYLNDPQKRRTANLLLEEADLAIAAIREIVPCLKPLVSWFETERLRIGPSDLPTLMARTGDIYGQLLGVLNLYMLPVDRLQEVQP